MLAIFPAIAAIFLAFGAQAHGDAAPAVSVKVAPHGPATAGKAYDATLTLTLADGTPATPDALQVVHTERVHLLVIDPTLTDYHHLHPEPGKKPGEYLLHFVPKRSGAYRLWADITPAGGQQVYAHTDIGTYPQAPQAAREEVHEVEAAGLTFTLTLDGRLEAGKATLATVTVHKGKAVFTRLEPLMGAYAHGVGFSEDGTQILHVHPMGDEPRGTGLMGGPELQFHLMPEREGFIRFFVQVRVNGKSVFAPFGLQVAGH